jgi:Ca2+-binding RTX toxin-like protein
MSSGAAGTDSLTGIENVLGGNGDDSILGDSLANVLEGGLGNDTLDGGAGNDTLIGGAGTDWASYASATGAVTVNLGAGMSSGAAGTDSLTGLRIVGGNGDDSILGDSLANVLEGGAGNALLTAEVAITPSLAVLVTTGCSPGRHRCP